jgi:hypothetical protein
MEQLQSHLGLTASSYMAKYLCLFSFIRKPLFIHDFATACSILNFLIYEGNFILFFISATCVVNTYLKSAFILHIHN